MITERYFPRNIAGYRMLLLDTFLQIHCIYSTVNNPPFIRSLSVCECLELRAVFCRKDLTNSTRKIHLHDYEAKPVIVEDKYCSMIDSLIFFIGKRLSTTSSEMIPHFYIDNIFE